MIKLCISDSTSGGIRCRAGIVAVSMSRFLVDGARGRAFHAAKVSGNGDSFLIIGIIEIILAKSEIPPAVG